MRIGISLAITQPSAVGGSPTPPVPFPPTFDVTAQGGLWSIDTDATSATLTSGGWQSVRTNKPQSSGKWYAEIKAQARPGVSMIFGVCSAPLNPKVLTSYVGGEAKSFGIRADGTAFVSTMSQDYSSGFAVSQGDTVMFAMDVDAGKFWLGVNGTWVSSGNPAAGTGYVAHWTPVAGELWDFAVAALASGTPYTARLYANAAEFTYTPPSGFSAFPTDTYTGSSRRIAVWAEGDSITTGNGGLQLTTGYPNLVPTTYQIGVGGNWAVAGSVVADMTTRASALDAFYPSVISPTVNKYVLTVLIGANDMGSVGGQSAATFLANLSPYLDARRAAGWYVGICTVLPQTLSGFNAKRNTANTTIRTWGGTHADFIIDFAADPVMGPDAAAADASLYESGLHPTEVGQQNLEAIYLAALQSVL